MNEHNERHDRAHARDRERKATGRRGAEGEGQKKSLFFEVKATTRRILAI